MSKAKTAKEVLQAVLWMYESGKLGWIQRDSYQRVTGEHTSSIIPSAEVKAACLAGAIELVERDNNMCYWNARSALMQKTGRAIITFNDNSSTTKDDVIKLLKETIEGVQ